MPVLKDLSWNELPANLVAGVSENYCLLKSLSTKRSQAVKYVGLVRRVSFEPIVSHVFTGPFSVE